MISAIWLALSSVICLRITLFFALNHICSKSCHFCFKSHHFRSISHHFCFKHKMRCKSLFVSTFLSTNQLLDQQNIGTVEPLSTDTSLIRTPLYYRQFAMSRQNSHIFSVKKKLYYRFSLIWTMHTKSRPQRVNSYKLNLSIKDTALIRWIYTVWILSSLADELHCMQGDLKPSCCTPINDLRKVYRGT